MRTTSGLFCSRSRQRLTHAGVVATGDRILLEVEGGRAVLVPVRGTWTEAMHGQGKEMWAKAGGADAYLAEERDSWEDR